MRIEKLRLPAYGPFTATEFDFTAGRGRLEIIYGPNEAGKTSLLRGISALLFGFPGQSKDAFVHPYGDLRIGATLEHGGKQLQFMRRKGNKSTLRHADDQTLLNDSDLQAFVPITSEQVFHLMFGLDAQRLAEGGQELLSGQGQFGSLLFGAATGIVGLRKIQENITASAEKLFKPKAHTSAIQLVLARRENSRKALREASVLVPFLEDLYARQEKAVASQEELRGTLEDRRASIARLERLSMAMGLLNHRRQCINELDTLGAVALLPDALTREFEEIYQRDRALAASRIQAELAIRSLEDELTQLVFSAPLLAALQRINALHKRLGAEMKAQADRPNLGTQLRGFESDMRELLSSLGEKPELVSVPGLRVPVPEEEQAANLIERFPVLESGIRQAQIDESGQAHELSTLVAKRAALPPDQPDELLRQAYDKLVTVSDLDLQAPLRRQKLEKAKAKLELKVQALPWHGGLPQLALAWFPAEEVVRYWKQRLDKAAQTIETARESVQTATQEVEQSRAMIQRQQAARRLSTLQDLEAGRSRRELGWQAVRHAWLDSKLDTSEAREFLAAEAEPIRLADTYAGSVAETDRLADDLRNHASEVAQLAQSQADLEAAVSRQEARSTESLEAQERSRQLVAEWATLWQQTDVTASAPEQMLVWLAGCRNLIEQNEVLAAEGSAIEGDAARVLAARGEVRLALAASAGQATLPDVTFAELKAAAAARLKQTDKDANDRQALLTQQRSLENKLAQARLKLEYSQKEMDSWKLQWNSLLERLQLSASAEPGMVKKILSLRESLAKKHDAASHLKARIDSIDRDTQEFEAQVYALAGEVALDLKGCAASDVVDQMHERLLQDSNTQKLRKAKENDVAEKRDQLRSLLAEAATVVARMQALIMEAGCESAADMPGLIDKSRQRRSLEDQRKGFEDQLLNIAGNSTLDELEVQAVALSPDFIPGRIEELKLEIAQFNDRRDQALKEEDFCAKSIGALSDQTAAAAAACDLEAANAEILELAEEYVRLSMTGQILRKAVEEYGSHASGPMMTRSSAIFAQLTRGSFCGLQLDVESEKTILVGVRPNGKIVQMEGMSEGTRDQLYLALRVASLELYFEQQAPMPLILDDLLVHFDDERAGSAIKVLSNLAQKTQVLLFTHHPHLVELARNCLSSECISIYRFGATMIAG